MCVAGVQTPAFVERPTDGMSTRRYAAGVAGVQTPAFVERCSTRPGRSPRSAVSPGFRLRPSLSEEQAARAGPRAVVSPGFRLRPSLSACRATGGSAAVQVSPGFRLRPSLSGAPARRWTSGATRGVAGVQTPAFVERLREGRHGCRPTSSVAGVQTPAFVERATTGNGATTPRRVSPGFRLRPSLSVSRVRGRPAFLSEVSPGFRLRPSLSGWRSWCAPGCRRRGVAGAVQRPGWAWPNPRRFSTCARDARREACRCGRG